MEKRRQSIFLTFILGLILIATPFSLSMAQEKATDPEKKQVIELELKEKKDLPEVKKEKEVKEKKAVTPEEGILEAEKKGFEKLLEEGIRLTPELESKIREAATKRLTRVLEETIGMSPIEEAFNQRVPSFKNRLDQEFKEKILTDRSLSPEEARTLRENLGKIFANGIQPKAGKRFPDRN